jgi:hypothetical protein
MLGIWSSKPSSPIKSIQRGTISIAGANTSNTATITAVDTAKTMLNWLGHTADGDIGLRVLMQLVLTNSTTVTATRQYNSGATVISFEAIEFN